MARCRDSLWRRRRGAPAGWVRTQRRCLLPQAKGTQACVAGSRSSPREEGLPAPAATRAASAAAAATRGRSRRPPAATARRGGLVSCGSCAAAAATRGRRRRAPCTPAAAPGAPTRARPRAFAAARAARGSGRSRSPTTPAALPAAHRHARLSALGGFGLERGGRERLTGLALRRARAAREHLGHHVVRLVVLVPRAARGVPLHRGGRARGVPPPSDPARQPQRSSLPRGREVDLTSSVCDETRYASGPGAQKRPPKSAARVSTVESPHANVSDA